MSTRKPTKPAPRKRTKQPPIWERYTGPKLWVDDRTGEECEGWFACLDSEAERELRSIRDDGAFIDQIDTAVVWYRFMRAQEYDNAKPADRRRKLEAIVSGVNRTLAAMRGLDALSRYHLLDNISGERAERFNDGRLADELAAIAVAAKAAYALVPTTKARSNARRALARGVAEVFGAYGVRVTGTPTGAFSRALRVAIAAGHLDEEKRAAPDDIGDLVAEYLSGKSPRKSR